MMRRGRPSILLCSLLMVGCGDDAKPGVGAVVSGSGGAPDSAGAAAGGAPGSAGAAEGGADSDSGGRPAKAGAGAGAAGGSAGAGLAPLVPLIAGRLSVFAYKPVVSNQPMLETCEAPKAEIGGPGEVSGHSGIFYSSPCQSDPYLIEGRGDQLTAHRISGGAIDLSYEYVHSPVVEGEEWTTNGATFEWRQLQTVDVPAGSFPDCWQRFTDDLSLDYCRGVGLVRMTSPSNNYVLELSDKNF